MSLHEVAVAEGVDSFTIEGTNAGPTTSTLTNDTGTALARRWGREDETRMILVMMLVIVAK